MVFSFAKRKRIVDLQPRVRRLCDMTAPNLATIGDAGRTENRYNRTIPTLLGPWQDDQAIVDECIVGITSDLADHGISLVLNQPFRGDSVVVGYWISTAVMSEPWFFLGDIRRNQAIGGGFWKVGLELSEFANPNYGDALAVLETLAAKLRAPDEEATA